MKNEKILDSFEALPEAERKEVALEILKRTASSQHGLPEEAELVAAADAVFLELDRQETHQ